MEATLCKRAVECITETQLSLNRLGLTSSILSYTDSNDDIMLDPLKNKELAMCILSNLIYYYDNDILNNNIKKWGIDYKLIILDTLVYIIFYSKDYIFIVFKGTTNFNEIFSDIDIIQIDDSYNIPGKIHRGFHNLILKNKIVESIKNELENITSNYSSIPIIITGHSLGAALATIFYAYLKTVYIGCTLELITFGSPRVGDYEFSKSLSSTRFVHGNDIITKLPFFKYKHIELPNTLGSFYSYHIFTDHYLEGYYLELLKNSYIVKEKLLC